MTKKVRYRFFEKDNVVFDIPSSIYDHRTASDWFKAVKEIGSTLDEWVILSIPDTSLTITSDAAAWLAENLPLLSEYGCKGVLVLATSINAKIFHHSIRQIESDFFIEMSDSMETLCRRASEQLNKNGALNIFHS